MCVSTYISFVSQFVDSITVYVCTILCRKICWSSFLLCKVDKCVTISGGGSEHSISMIRMLWHLAVFTWNCSDRLQLLITENNEELVIFLNVFTMLDILHRFEKNFTTKLEISANLKPGEFMFTIHRNHIQDNCKYLLFFELNRASCFYRTHFPSFVLPCRIPSDSDDSTKIARSVFYGGSFFRRRTKHQRCKD